MESMNPDNLSRISFAAALVVLAYTAYRGAKPPNASLEGKGEVPEKDLIGRTLGSSPSIMFWKYNHSLMLLWNAALVLFPPSSIVANGKLYQSDPNPWVMNWNAFSTITVLCGVLGGYIRIRTYESLGKDFTFQLRNPSRLNTTGLYSYVQHPSYTGAILMGSALPAFVYRLDGPLATVLAPWIVEKYEPFVRVSRIAFIVAVPIGLALRIREEEAMLKKKFGKEWIDWHKRTARLIPFVL